MPLNLPTQDLGQVDQYLGVDISVNRKCITLKQGKGISAFLSEMKFQDQISVSFPLEPGADYSSRPQPCKQLLSIASTRGQFALPYYACTPCYRSVGKHASFE